MRKLTLLLAVVLLSAFTVKKQGLTRDDREVLLNHFQETRDNLLKAVDGLSDEQMDFKPAPDRWSVRQCLEHIILSEKGLFEMQQNAMKQPADPEKRKTIKATDEGLLKMLADRSQKGKAPEMIQPKGTYPSTAAAIQAFTEQRDKIVDYAKNTHDDLRNHVVDMPNAPLDGYQMLLLISAHTGRHTVQIEEVKAAPGFPAR